MFGKKFVFLFLIAFVKCADLPEYLRNLKCRNDDKLRECFIKNGNIAIPLVARGDKDYGLPKMTPLEIPFVQLIKTPALQMNLTNLKMYGLEKMRIQDVSWGCTLWNIKRRTLTINGQYGVDGKILIMPIKGEGDFSIYLKNGIYKMTITSQVVQRDGDTYYKNADGRLDSQFQKIDFRFENLFEGNKQLGDQVNNFLNENWDLIIDDFGPGIANTMTKFIMRIYNAFTAKVPAKNFFIS